MYPVIGGPILLGQRWYDPLLPELLDATSFEMGDDLVDRVATDLNQDYRRTTAPGLLALVPVMDHPEATRPYSKVEVTPTCYGCHLESRLKAAQRTLATIIMGASPDPNQATFMQHFGLPLTTWSRSIATLLDHHIHKGRLLQLVSIEAFNSLIILLLRLSHTAPEVLFPYLRNRGDYTKATMVSIAWWVAILNLGRNYPPLTAADAGGGRLGRQRSLYSN